MSTVSNQNFVGLTIMDIHKKFMNKKLTVHELVDDIFNLHTLFDNYNFSHTLFKNEALKQAQKLDQNLKESINNNWLYGIPYAAKDNFAVKNTLMTAGTLMLKNFNPPYESTATLLLKAQNSILISKTNLDELGMGGSGLYSAFGDVYNPYNKHRITGGSSSGSAGIVAAGIVPWALGTDTGDSIRIPANYCGIVGFKPSYGLISRYGVVPYAPSLDTIGYFTRSVQDAALLLDVLAKHDPNDFTNIISNESNYLKNLKPDISKYKIVSFKNITATLDPELNKLYHNMLNKLAKNNNIQIEEINFPELLLGSIEPIYIIISYCEAVSCHANLDGINFGTRIEAENYNEIMSQTCSHNFKPVVKKRFVIGSYILHKKNQKHLFLKAKKIRYLICQELKGIFKKYDAFLLPGAKDIAPFVKDIKNSRQYSKTGHFQYSQYGLILSNFLGNPSLTVPMGFKQDMPFGINVNCDILQEQKILNIAYAIENITNLKNLQVNNFHQKQKNLLHHD